MRYLSNLAFQYYWKYFRAGKVSFTTMLDYERHPGIAAEQIAAEILEKLKCAEENFPYVRVLLLGDSNWEFGDTPAQMAGFGMVGVVVNGGRAGSRLDHLAKILRSKSGIELRHFLRDRRIAVILNSGGNHPLQGAMANMEENARDVKALLNGIEVIAADLPDVMAEALSALYNIPADEIKKAFAKGNEILQKTFEHFIPLGMVLSAMDRWNNVGKIIEIATGTLSDGLVHYSPKFNRKVRFPYYARFLKATFGG